jgi:hypothetical protein
MFPYHIQQLQTLTQHNYTVHLNFANMMCEWETTDNQWLHWWMFTDEATFHMSGQVNISNSIIWGTKNPHVYYKLQQATP